ncbi:hypothetical protein CVUC_08100 [Caulobacter vibrioides]|nr:hypothetical protein CA608_00165 [Caulobacter vibrioides]PLR13275.1 hypothetical protein CVUC_08100 [Caulobacter vibrioides]
MLIVVEWDVNEHPAVLISAEALLRSLPKLRATYPNGFCLADPQLSEALIVSFDDERVEVEIDLLELAPAH